MKVTMNIDCTPEEARAFFGLPDVKPMQEAFLAEMQARLGENLKAMTPDAMMKIWLGTFKGLEEMQEKFFARMAAARPSEK